MFCGRTTTRMLLAGMFAIMDGGNNINKVKHTDNEADGRVGITGGLR